MMYPIVIEWDGRGCLPDDVPGDYFACNTELDEISPGVWVIFCGFPSGPVAYDNCY